VRGCYGRHCVVSYTARVVGTFTDGGAKFDASKRFSFAVGKGEVISGWDLTLLGSAEGGLPPMHVGGLRTVQLPSALAYGPRGAGCRAGTCVIPPDAELSFAIELLSVRKAAGGR